MNYYPESPESDLHEVARRRNEGLRASDQTARSAAENDQDASPDAEFSQADLSGRQHDYGDTAAHQPARRDLRAPRR